VADLNSLGNYGTAATERDGLLEVGVTQDSQVAATQQARLADASKKASSLDGTVLGTSGVKFNLNPLAIGPTPPPAYQQPDTAAHPNGASVTIENVRNPLQITSPLPRYSQPGTAAPPPPAPGQLSTMSYGSIGTSGAVRADGSRIF
jgi:hypothetical protein